MANAKQGSSKAAGERSHLLGLSPPPPDRLVPPSSGAGAGAGAGAAASLSPPKASLTQLATERLGSLKWLMARDVTISPPSRGPTRLGGGGGGGAAAAGSGGAAAAAAAAGLSVVSQQAGRVRRSASADIDGVAVASEPRPTRGLFSSGSGLAYDNSRARPPGVTAGNTRRAFGKNAYRLSIDLERAPMGSSVWVKSRRSSVRTPRSAASTPGGSALGLKEADSQGQGQSRSFGRGDSSGQEEGNIEIVDSEDESGAAGGRWGIGDTNLTWGWVWPCGIVAATGLWAAAVAALFGLGGGAVAGCAVVGILLSAVLCLGLATTRVFVGMDEGEGMEGFRDDGFAEEEEEAGGARGEGELGAVVGAAEGGGGGGWGGWRPSRFDLLMTMMMRGGWSRGVCGGGCTH